MAVKETVGDGVLESEHTAAGVRRVLEAIQDQLGMDIAFLGEFQGDDELFRVIVGDAGAFGLHEGAVRPRAGTYCEALVEGRIETIVPDTTADPALAQLEMTTRAGIGCFVGVPIHLPGGALYGAICGVRHAANPDLKARDARLLSVFAGVVEAELAREYEQVDRHLRHVARLQTILSGDGLTMAFQPMVNVKTGGIAGFEALARFTAEPIRTPDLWFAEAAQAGLGLELEMAAITLALGSLDRLEPGAFVSINASAETACSPALAQLLATVDCSRVVLEITEHAAVSDYEGLLAALAGLRLAGLRLAVDDAGAGVASLHHVLALAPEFIKMDISLTRGIDADPARAALAQALVSFGAATGAAILAEGVETAGEFAAITRLGVSYAQGYFLGRPAPLVAPRYAGSSGTSTAAWIRPPSGARRLAQGIAAQHRGC